MEINRLVSPREFLVRLTIVGQAARRIKKQAALFIRGLRTPYSFACEPKETDVTAMNFPSLPVPV